MINLTLRSLRAHRSRLTLTIFAVAAAVAFVTASFVLADSLRAVFGDVSAKIYRGVDAEIRAGEGTFDTVETGDRFDVAALDDVTRIDGIASVTPVLGGENVVFAVGSNGDVLRQTGPPTLTFSTFGDSPASPFSTATGAAPGTGEVMLDTAQARALGVDIGDPVSVTGPTGTETFTLSGTIVFGVEESGVSPYFLLFDLETMQRLLEAGGQIDSASLLLANDADLLSVLPTIEASLPDGLVVADRATLVAEQNAEFGEVIDLIGTALLAFAAIALFVSTFVIANTFAVIVGQQRQQMGLLRAVGARRGQATAVVVAEAAVVGAIASVLGLLGGLGVAEGIKAMVEAVTSGGFPEGPTQVLPRTIIAALLVGIGVTTLSAFLPARRAGAVSPLAAMRSDADAALATEMAGRVGPPLQRVLGATIGRLGPAGQLAATGVARHPRRVLTATMSMIVGLALIASMAVLGSSYRSTLEAATTGGLDADVVITGDDGVDVPYPAVDELVGRPEIDAVSGYGTTEVIHDGVVIPITGHNSATAGGVVVFESTAGELGPIDVDEVFIGAAFAENRGLTVGDTTTVVFSDGYRAELTVRAIVADSALIEAPLIVDEGLISTHARNADADFAAVRFSEGVDPSDGERLAANALSDHPQLTVESIADYVAGRQAQADQIMTLANALLGLTLVIALIGIANTVALSLIERRSELGLLRAVGMSRRQIRKMVRYEALVLSTLGALTGLTIGIGLATLAVAILPDSFAASLQIPVASLAIATATCIAFGVAAAVLPARRAARLDVLDAISLPN